MKLILPGEKPLSWNRIYSAGNWKIRNSLASSIHRTVVRELERAGWQVQDKKMFKGKVDINIVAYFATRMLDADNIAAKFYIDGLKMICILDDDPKYVRSVRTESVKDKKNPRIEIEIREI